jgi:ATP-dependent DNA helicase RecG
LSEIWRRSGGEVAEKWRRSGGERLSERQKRILKQIEQNNTISVKEISTSLQVTDRTVEREIQKLRNMGIIERIGGDRGGYWKIMT